MNPHSQRLEANQTHFGLLLLRFIEEGEDGIATWLAKRGEVSLLVHVLPLERALTETELRPIHRLRHLGEMRGRALRQITVAGHVEAAGRPPMTAVLENFPPLPTGAEGWLTLLEWVQKYGPATAACISPHLEHLEALLRDLPGGRHGALSPTSLWLAVNGDGNIYQTALARVGLGGQEDLAVLGRLLFFWLTGLNQLPSDHRAVQSALVKVRAGSPLEDRTPDHWRREIALSLDPDPTYHQRDAMTLLRGLRQYAPAPAAAGGEVGPANAVSTWKRIAALAAVILLGGGVLVWQQMRSQRVAPPQVQEAQDSKVKATPPPAPKVEPSPLPEPKPEPQDLARHLEGIPEAEKPEPTAPPKPPQVTQALPKTREVRAALPLPPPQPRTESAEAGSQVKKSQTVAKGKAAPKAVSVSPPILKVPEAQAAPPPTPRPSHETAVVEPAKAQTSAKNPPPSAEVPRAVLVAPPVVKAVPIVQAVPVEELAPPAPSPEVPEDIQMMPGAQNDSGVIRQAAPRLDAPPPLEPDLPAELELKSGPPVPGAMSAPSPMPPPVFYFPPAPPPGFWESLRELFVPPPRFLPPPPPPPQPFRSRAHIPGQPDQPLWQRP